MATNVAQLVNQLVIEFGVGLSKKYNRNFDNPAFMINEGSCEDFAEELVIRINAICDPKWEGYAIAKWEYEYDSRLESIHCFVEFNGRFYDSETPEGVNDFLELPIYRRESPFRLSYCDYGD